MWGRLDGAGWLVQALLDPKRIKAIVDAHPETYPEHRRARQFLQQLRTLAGSPDESECRYLIAARRELSYLDDGRDPPASLPETARWVARSWQRRVVQNELPVVASEALATPTNKRQTWAMDVLKEAGQADQAVAAARLATAQVSSGRIARMTRDEAKSAPAGGPAPQPDGMVALLPSCPIPDETLGQERGEPLFTRTAAKLIAVATAALTAVDQAPVTVGALFRTARTVTLTGYRAANTVGFVPRRLVLAGIVLAAAGAVLASQGSTLFGITGLVSALAGIYLICFGVWSWSSRALEALVAFAVVLGVFALTTPMAREHLYGTGDDTKAGWVSDTVVPWLRDTWWAPLVILAVLVVVPVVATLVTRRVVPRPRTGNAGRPVTVCQRRMGSVVGVAAGGAARTPRGRSMSLFGQCKDMTIKFVNNTGQTVTVPAEGHRVKNQGSAEAWNNLQLGESVNDLAPGASHSTRQTLNIKCVDDAQFEIHYYTSTVGGEFTQLFTDRNIEDKQAVLTLTKH